jgi:hypothetical protein
MCTVTSFETRQKNLFIANKHHTQTNTFLTASSVQAPTHTSQHHEAHQRHRSEFDPPLLIQRSADKVRIFLKDAAVKLPTACANGCVVSALL